MKGVVLLFAIGTLVTGFTAAWYWYQSSKIPIESTHADARTIEMATLGIAAGTLQTLQKVAALNKKAALWTAVSVLLGADTVIRSPTPRRVP